MAKTRTEKLLEEARLRSAGIRFKHDHRRPTAKLCRAVEVHGVPLTDSQLYAANTVTVDELAYLLAEEGFVQARAYAQEQERRRQDAMAEQWEASR